MVNAERATCLDLDAVPIGVHFTRVAAGTAFGDNPRARGGIVDREVVADRRCKGAIGVVVACGTASAGDARQCRGPSCQLHRTVGYKPEGQTAARISGGDGARARRAVVVKGRAVLGRTVQHLQIVAAAVGSEAEEIRVVHREARKRRPQASAGSVGTKRAVDVVDIRRIVATCAPPLS
jgi:hypothetical protein